jgi:hypothetical protein
VDSARHCGFFSPSWILLTTVDTPPHTRSPNYKLAAITNSDAGSKSRMEKRSYRTWTAEQSKEKGDRNSIKAKSKRPQEQHP